MSGGKHRRSSGFGLFSSSRRFRSGGGFKNIIGFGAGLFNAGNKVVGVGTKFATIINNRLDKRKEMFNHNQDEDVKRAIAEHERFKRIEKGTGIHRDAE